ncbi:MAG: hypothetical protein AAGB48_06895 [Planctomycetota bacterium]
MDPSQLDQVHELVEALREHPLWAQSGLIIALVVGVMLWASGRRVLKPAFAVIGALLGGFMGHVTLPAIGVDEVGGIPGDIVGAAAGGMAGALGAVLIFRLAIGVLTSGVLAGLGILVAAVLIQMNPAPAHDASGQPIAGEIAPVPVDEQNSGATNPLGSITLEDTQEAVKDPGAFARDLFLGLKADVWDPLSTRDRTLLGGAAFLGLLLGLGASVFFPKKSTALVTAFAGAGMWLPSVYLLSQALDLPGKTILERTAVQWTAIWLVVSLTGLLIQTVGLKERGRRDGGRDRSGEDDWDDEQAERRQATRAKRKQRKRERDEDDDDWE